MQNEINPQVKMVVSRLCSSYSKPITDELLNVWNDGIGHYNGNVIYEAYLKIIKGEIRFDASLMPTVPQFVEIIKMIDKEKREKLLRLQAPASPEKEVIREKMPDNFRELLNKWSLK